MRRSVLVAATMVAALVIAPTGGVGASPNPELPRQDAPPSTDPATTDPATPDEAAAPSQPPAFSVSPSGPKGEGGRDYFVYTLPPGSSFGDYVAIANLSDSTQTFVVYATDAFNTEGDASFALLRDDEEPTDVGTWVTLGADQYTVAPGDRVLIPFEVKIPTDATPGDHVGAIVAQPLKTGTGTPDNGVSFDVNLRIGARMYVRVDGPRTPSLTIEQLDVDYDQPVNPFAGGTANVTYRVTNTGNLRLTGNAVLDIEGPFGINAGSAAPRQLPELLPGGSIEIAEKVTGVRSLLHLTADLTVTAEAEDYRTSASVSWWTVPWLLIIIVLLAIAALLLWWWARRRRAREAVA